MKNYLIHNQFIVTLDVDKNLFKRLRLLAQTSVNVVEINTSDIALLQTIMTEFKQLHIGVGNITNIQQLEACYQAGVSFASSLGFSHNLAKTALVYSMEYLPGISTMSDAMQLMDIGYTQAKNYPANLAFCTSLNTYLPELQLLPTTIDWQHAAAYLTLKSVMAVSVLNPTDEIIHTIVKTAELAPA